MVKTIGGHCTNDTIITHSDLLEVFREYVSIFEQNCYVCMFLKSLRPQEYKFALKNQFSALLF